MDGLSGGEILRGKVMYKAVSRDSDCPELSLLRQGETGDAELVLDVGYAFEA